MDAEPDCFDLNDWLVFNHPTVHAATRYLNPGAQYNVRKAFWESEGKPNITIVWT